MTLEAFLATIYTDGAARGRFLADPEADALRAGLPAPVARQLASIDLVGLELAADSFTRKRAPRDRRSKGGSPSGSLGIQA